MKRGSDGFGYLLQMPGRGVFPLLPEHAAQHRRMSFGIVLCVSHADPTGDGLAENVNRERASRNRRSQK
jgi:hypothetical protein